METGIHCEQRASYNGSPPSRGRQVGERFFHTNAKTIIPATLAVIPVETGIYCEQRVSYNGSPPSRGRQVGEHLFHTNANIVIPATLAVIPVETGIHLNAMSQYYVYILASKTYGTLYIGVTNDLVKRVYQHKNDLVDGFTKRYGVHKLVYHETHSDVNTAITREKQMKKWNRQWKINLIEKMNPEWKDLYIDIVGDPGA